MYSMHCIHNDFPRERDFPGEIISFGRILSPLIVFASIFHTETGCKTEPSQVQKEER